MRRGPLAVPVIELILLQEAIAATTGKPGSPAEEEACRRADEWLRSQPDETLVAMAEYLTLTRDAIVAARPTKERAPLEAAEVVARRVGRLIGSRVPEGWGFVLVLASAGGDGFSTFVSNLEAPGSVQLLEEIARKMRSRDPGV